MRSQVQSGETCSPSRDPFQCSIKKTATRSNVQLSHYYLVYAGMTHDAVTRWTKPALLVEVEQDEFGMDRPYDFQVTSLRTNDYLQTVLVGTLKTYPNKYEAFRKDTGISGGATTFLAEGVPVHNAKAIVWKFPDGHRDTWVATTKGMNELQMHWRKAQVVGRQE